MSLSERLRAFLCTHNCVCSFPRIYLLLAAQVYLTCLWRLHTI